MEIKKNLTQCPNGHFYDASVHSTCPYCGNAAGKGNFSETIAPGASGASAGAFSETIAPGAGNPSAGNFSETIAPGSLGGGGAGYMNPTMPVSHYHNDGAASGNEPFEPTMIGGYDVIADRPAPVVGWLVCIDGPLKGTDFRMHAGYNYIGRDAGDIHIHGDRQISRENHAMIAFDSTDLTYFFGPANGRNLVKVNGKTVFNAVELNAYDVISIGTTKLMFVPFCGSHFNWEMPNG